MDYKKIYDSLIDRARSREIDEKTYYEAHHVKPKCIGGDNKKENLVMLLAEEHYVAHLLLAKIYPQSSGLVFAANMMANRNNKTYSWVKKRFALENAKKHKGLKHSECSKQKMSASKKGVPKSSSHKENIRKRKLKRLEYKGKTYLGYENLLEETGVSRHLYIKFYQKGFDPEPYIGNNTYKMIEANKLNHPKNASGCKWYNDGETEKYFRQNPSDGWTIGRLRRFS